MTSRDFCCWLQGLFELSDCDANKTSVNQQLSIQQVTTIKNHLAMVFKHEIDPSFGDEAHQKKLAETHGGLALGSGPAKFNC